MKKILFLIILVCLMAGSLNAQTYVGLSTKDSIIAFIATDMILVQRLVGGDYENRKMFADQLFEEILELRDSLLSDADFFKAVDDIRDSLLTADNTFSGTNTFSDSLLATSRQWFTYLNPYSATSFIGDYSNPFLRMYSKNFVLVNTDTGDSSYVYLDDQNRVVFDADLQLIDSTKSIGSSATGDQARAVWTDSVNANYDLVLYSKNRTINTYSMLSKWAEVIPVNNSTTSITVNTNVVALTNTNTASIDTIYIDAEFLDGYEEEVLIYNRGTFDVIFTPDNAGNYGIELEVSGDDTLGQFDSIRLLFDANSQRWIKTGGVDIK